MLISELATAAGVKVSSIRFYERRGLLEPPRRSSGGYREYGDADVTRVRYLKRGQELGFTLSELGGLVARPVAGDVGALGAAKLVEIDQRITDLVAMREALAGLLAAQCIEPEAPCPVMAALSR